MCSDVLWKLRAYQVLRHRLELLVLYLCQARESTIFAQDMVYYKIS